MPNDFVKSISRFQKYKVVDALEERQTRDDGKETTKIVLLGICRCVNPDTWQVVESDFIEHLLKTGQQMGSDFFDINSFLQKVKLMTDDWVQFARLGVREGSVLDLDVLPNIYKIKQRNGEWKEGLWYKPILLYSIDGREVNYQIAKKMPNPRIQKSVLNRGNSYDSDFAETEYQIESELAEIGG